MKKRISCVAALCCALPVGALAHSFGADPGYSGAPGDSDCTACHGGRPNSGPGKVAIAFAAGTSYVPGQTTRVTVTVADPNARRWGFEASPRMTSDAANTGAGILAAVDANTQLLPPAGTVQWMTHTSAGTRPGTTGSASFEFDWTAPAAGAGAVTFYVAANAANGNGAPTGDLIYTASATLTPADAGTTAARPALNTQNGVLNGASLQPGLVAGSWFAVFGANFGSTTRIWNAATEIVDGNLPQSLDGVGVTVNGKPAAIYFISPGQINAQAPDDAGLGPVEVVVTTPTGTSDPVIVDLQPAAPGLFVFDPLGRKYAAAVAADGSYLGPAALFGDALATRTARPGETILLFGTGFGRTDPPVPPGKIFTGAASLAEPASVTIAGLPAAVAFAGLSGAGLYQINVTVPANAPPGDQPVVVRLSGRTSQDGVVLAVGR